MTHSRKLRIAFFIMLAVTLVGGVVAVVTIRSVSQSDSRTLRDVAALASATEAVRSAVSDKEMAYHSEVLKRGTGTRMHSTIAELYPAIQNAVGNLTGNTAITPEIQDQILETQKLAKAIDAETTKSLKRLGGGVDVSQLLDISNDVNPLLMNIDRQVDSLNWMTERRRNELAAANESRGNKAVILIIVILAVEALIGIGLALFLPRRITRDLKNIIERLIGTAAELLAGAGQLAAGAAETSAAVSETAATVDEVERTARASAEAAETVAKAASSDQENALRGSQAAVDMVDGMRAIDRQMALVAESVVRLGDQLETATAVIDTSSDIAEQSNVLAVNAAIEAAKAAEHSRSFGVVADEMHSLAQQSKAAVVQVRDSVSQIRKAATEVVDAAENSSVTVSEGLQQAAKTNESFENIVSNTAAGFDEMTQIVASSKQQFTAIEQIVESMSSIDAATAQVASSAQHMRSRATVLRDVAEDLHRMIERDRRVALDTEEGAVETATEV